MPDDFKSIKEIFNNNPELKKIKETINQNDVINDFELIFPDFKKIVKPVRVENGTLTLKVENASWRTELKFKETEIIEKINSFYKEKRIIKIKFSAK
ncbi:MAG TPA: DUF721 domain-containing protein [Ignavibacteriaceae bacterium]|jgi:hypothetical protein|nr:DUF721 domain-containing protein [Ignavibacteriaceae bacterium]